MSSEQSSDLYLEKPLVVDLDGTLIKTDLLSETANQFIIRYPFRLVYLFIWLVGGGRSHLKARLAQTCPIDVGTLPYNRNLVSWLRQQHLAGRQIILATASHRILAEQVSKHIGVFNEVLASEGTVNLKAVAKRDRLVHRFGEKGFDYIGNDTADLPVWEMCNAAYVVGSSFRLINKIHAFGKPTQVFTTESPPLSTSIVKALRPHQWLKNILIFIPLLAAQHFGYLGSDMNAIIAFFVFSLTASSVYILNDLVDIVDDRHHDYKQKRPLAAGDIGLLLGWLMWPSLLVFSFGLAVFSLSTSFIIVLGCYFILSTIYSLKLKQSVILDVLILAILYTLRIIAGATAIGVPLSFWMLTFSMFIFLSLAYIKRFSELKLARHARQDGQIRGRGYVHQDLEIVSSMGVGSGFLAVLVLALYIQDGHTAGLYHSPQIIWLACPILYYWISRAWLITHRGQMHDDPIIFAIKDRVSWIVCACFLGVFILAKVA